MNYLHSLVPPIVHRDLRSPNVFLVSLDPDSDIIAKVMLRFYSDAAVVVAAAVLLVTLAGKSETKDTIFRNAERYPWEIMTRFLSLSIYIY